MIIIEGPTAVGKSDIAVELAKIIGGEIVSADSMQVYRGMDIGTGKIRKEEMSGIPHYMLDVTDPSDDYDISRYAASAKEACMDISARGKYPIICGGTGFYIQAVVKDIDFSKGSPETSYRRELEEYAKEHGNAHLHDMLAKVDPPSARAIHPNNVKKVIRALEYYRMAGERLSDKNERDRRKESPYDVLEFFINENRKVLYEKIEKRIDRMMDEGLVDEVRHLREAGLQKDCVSMQGLGYKEIIEYLDGDVTLDAAVDTLKKRTRHYAKRQVTWFTHQGDPVEIRREEHGNDNRQIAEYIAGIIKEHYLRN